MIITCQNCQTHYSVDVGLLGGGKTVRCENCGNSWHQHPQLAAPPPPMAPPPQPVYAAEVPQAPLQQPFDAAPAPAPVPVPEPIPEPAPEPEPMPDPMPDPEAAPEADADAELAAMEEDAGEEPAMESDGEEAGDTPATAEADNDALSPNQLDEMFGEEKEGEGFDALSTSGGGGGDDETTDLADLENLPDPDPIPQVFSTGDDDVADDGLEKKGKGKIIAIAALVLILALGGGAYFGRSMIIELYPPAADIFAMIGLGGGELGDGLVIKDVKSSRQIEGGVDVLVIRGVIANVAEDDRMVPMIRVSLFDASKVEVQHAIAAPLKNRLQA